MSNEWPQKKANWTKGYIHHEYNEGVQMQLLENAETKIN